MNKRKSGLLLALSSLPGNFGIGGFGKEAFKFIDFLRESKQSYWQILPLGPTGYGNSPYSSFSSLAGSPLYIDLEELLDLELLTKEELEAAKMDPGPVDYEGLFKIRLPLLRRASKRVTSPLKERIEGYKEANPWLDDFALFMCIKEVHGGTSWLDWSEDFRCRKRPALDYIRRSHQEDYDFWVFTQYFFHRQRQVFLDYAQENQVEILGDIPFYVAEDSVEVWTRPELFLLGQEGFVAGTPPDFFTEEGQLWGNPIYNFEYMKRDNFSWWVDRLRKQCQLYHILRLDHFNGFARYWKIPQGRPSKEGIMEEGFGYEILGQLKDLADRGCFIAEDLGSETEAAQGIRQALAIPGMRILQVGFSPGEDNPHLPHSYEKDLFVYTGTHDNEPIMAWFSLAPEGVRRDVMAYLNSPSPGALDFIRVLMASSANSVIIPVQDLLGLGMEARMNLPGSLEDNWVWRLSDLESLEKYKKILAEFSTSYRRNLESTK